MTKKTKLAKKASKSSNRHKVQPFAHHVGELRTRLFYVVSAIVFFAGIGATFRNQLIEILLKPSEAQQFVYTTPGGGFDFNFRVVLYFGIACAVPVLIYNIFQFVSPLLRDNSAKFFVKTTIASSILAAIGVMFGYYVSLPAALHFLLNQFNTDQIAALLSVQEYMNFVMVYLIGFAILFQIPLILLFINRIKPLKPSKLMRSQRWVFAISFIVAAIITPTGDALNMAIMAGPIILMYQFGVISVWISNKYNKVDKIERLRHQDELMQQKRIEQRQQANELFKYKPEPAVPSISSARNFDVPSSKPQPAIRPAMSPSFSSFTQQMTPSGRILIQ